MGSYTIRKTDSLVLWFMQSRAFTLLELLIVMAILGVLAVVIFVALNPKERQAQARDSGRISAVAQVGRSLQAYYTALSTYPDVSNWAQSLIDEGELSSFPTGIAYTSGINPCTTYQQPASNPTYCYDEDMVGGNGILVFSKAEAASHRGKCTSPEEAYFVFSSADARGGTICSNGDPAPWPAGSMTYVE